MGSPLGLFFELIFFKTSECHLEASPFYPNSVLCRKS